ncbi:MAG TPA: hypothetical protein VGH79_02085 [Gaiellaceae bacterium]|jgi:hypothetical protein
MDVIASDFLAGSILTLVVPIVLLVAIGIWWMSILRRRKDL